MEMAIGVSLFVGMIGAWCMLPGGEKVRRRRAAIQPEVTHSEGAPQIVG